MVLQATGPFLSPPGEQVPAPTRCEQTSALPAAPGHGPAYLLVHFMGDEGGSFLQFRHADGPDPERHLGGKARPPRLDGEGCGGPQREGREDSRIHPGQDP